MEKGGERRREGNQSIPLLYKPMYSQQALPYGVMISPDITSHSDSRDPALHTTSTHTHTLTHAVWYAQ